MLYSGLAKMNIVGAGRCVDFQFAEHLAKSVIAMAPAGFVLKQYVRIEETAFEITEFYVERIEISFDEIEHVVGIDWSAEIYIAHQCDGQTLSIIACHFLLPCESVKI